MTLEEFKTVADKNTLNSISSEIVYNYGIMCSWSTNIKLKTTDKYSSKVFVKDMSVEDFCAQRRINNYIEKQINNIKKLQMIKEDFE